jgi:hypothetical protein
LSNVITYSKPESINPTTPPYKIQSVGYVLEDHLNASRALLSRTKHYYYGNTYSAQPELLGYSSSWTDGKEYQTDLIADNGTTILRRINYTWQQRAHLSWWNSWVASRFYTPDPSALEPPNDPRLVETVTTLMDITPNLVSKQSAINPTTGAVGFDSYNNQTDVYDYGNGYGAAPTYPLRHKHTDYLTTNPQNGINYPSTAHIRNLLTVQSLFEVNPSNGTETLIAQSETRYDEPAYYVLTYGAITGWSDPGTAARGQATTTRRWLNTTGGYIETHAQYDQAGNLRNVWDGRGQLWQTG